VLLRALIFMTVAVATASGVAAETRANWIVEFQDAKREMGMRCNFSPARLTIIDQSAMVSFEPPIKVNATSVKLKSDKPPAFDLSFDLVEGDTILMTGAFDGDRARGTWKSPSLSCEGAWTARRSLPLRGSVPFSVWVSRLMSR
jgi:hypothetical protein